MGVFLLSEAMPVSYFPILIWIAFAWANGALGLCAARQWVTPDARWYEWGILSGLVATVVFPFIWQHFE